MRRLVLAAGLWCLLAVSVTAAVLITLFEDHLVREANEGLADQVVELVALSRVDLDGRLRLAGRLTGTQFQRPFSGWAWQVRRGEEILAQSPSLGPLGPGAVVLAAPAGAAGLFEDESGRVLRGLSRVTTPPFASARLVFAIARPEDEITAAVDQFRRTVLIALALLGLGLIATVVAAFRIGLGPLGRLREEIARIRAGEDPPPRPWPREIAPVAREIAALREHNARLVSRAGALTADLAHAIKTPLSVIRQQAGTLGAEDQAVIRRQAERIGRSLERYLGRSSAGGTAYGRVSVGPCIEDLVFSTTRTRPDKALRVTREVSEDAVFLGDEADLYEIIGNPLDNAGTWATARIRVSARNEAGRLAIGIEDDGPGIEAAHCAAILERGRRLDETLPGQGIGLAVLQDLTELYGGTLTLGRSPLGGLSVRITLPAAARPD